MSSHPTREVLMFPKGMHKTMIGFRAIVAQLRSINKRWILIGAILNQGVLYLHTWNAAGKSLSGQTMFDLTRF